MDILSIVAAVFKRWYVTAPIVLIALGAAYYVNTTIPPQYQAQGQILLASPDLDPEGLPRSVVNLSEVAGEAATNQAQAAMVEGSANLNITARVRALVVEVDGSTADVVEATYANAVSWLEEAVSQRQDDAGIDIEEQLLLVQDGEVALRELDEGGFEIAARLGLVDPTAGVPNPFGANNGTARILIVAIQSDAGQLSVAERTGPGVGFSVGQQARDAAAIIDITTSGSDPQRVIEAYDHVADVIEAELTDREARAEVPETRRTRIERIAAPQRVTDTSPPLDRTVAAIIGLGGIVALVIAVLLESIAGRRVRAGTADRLPTDQQRRPGVARDASTGRGNADEDQLWSESTDEADTVSATTPDAPGGPTEQERGIITTRLGDRPNSGS